MGLKGILDKDFHLQMAPTADGVPFNGPWTHGLKSVVGWQKVVDDPMVSKD